MARSTFTIFVLIFTKLMISISDTIDIIHISSEDCRLTQKGTQYRGRRNTTISGLTCQRWDAQTPHKHSRNNVNNFPLAAYNEENYCRNPDDSIATGPWCYTTDPKIRWESCGVPLCPDCRHSALGADYRGFRSYTASGIPCQRWDSQYPHRHELNDVKKYPNTVANDLNLCRNPSLSNETEGPWCYTMDPNVRWETCGIPLCEECIRSSFGTEYRGTKHTTRTGKMCQRWDTQAPHNHNRNNVTTFPLAIYNEANYCRNPDETKSGLWCYTTDPNARWDACDVDFCAGSRTISPDNAVVDRSHNKPVHSPQPSHDVPQPQNNNPARCSTTNADAPDSDYRPRAKRTTYLLHLIVISVVAVVVIAALSITLAIICYRKGRPKSVPMAQSVHWAGPRALPHRPGSAKKKENVTPKLSAPNLKETGKIKHNTTDEDDYNGYMEPVIRPTSHLEQQDVYEQLFE